MAVTQPEAQATQPGQQQIQENIDFLRINPVSVVMPGPGITNSYGYRTHEFDSISSPYLLVAGDRLTEGPGLHLSQTWPHKLETQSQTTVINLAKDCANAEFICQNIIKWINSDFPYPDAVLVQWPNPYMLFSWPKHGEKSLFRTPDALYKLKIKHGEEYFFVPWIKSIVDLNQLCRYKNIPIVHLCFESPEAVDFGLGILKAHDIDLNLDLKKPGLTWHFDSSGADNMHHSEWCHDQWTKRILTLLKCVLQ
jgi:hypothetical protein